MCDYLDALSLLFTGKITFSYILPIKDTTFYHGIYGMNADVGDHCWSRGFGVFRVADFTRSKVNTKVDIQYTKNRSMWARDGLHLGATGIESVYDALSAYLQDEFKYDHNFEGPYC
jgi:hypothetical protein